MPTAPAGSTFRYQVYGITIASDRPLEDLAAVAIDAGTSAHLHFVEMPSSPLPDGWAESPPVYVSPLREPDGRSRLQIFRVAGFDILAFTGIADFFLSSAGVWCRPCPGAAPAVVQAHLLSSVLAYWFEGRERVCLHASAVSVGGLAIAVMARSGGGKSGIVSAVAAAGHGFLTDDITVFEQGDAGTTIRRGFPVVRLWPDAARVFVGAVDDLPLVGDGSNKRRVRIDWSLPHGTALDEPTPCAALLLAERRPESDPSTAISMTPVRGGEAVVELVRHSFVGRLVAAAGQPETRFDRLARLAQDVPLFRMSYPTGYQHLPDVVRALERLVVRDRT